MHGSLILRFSSAYLAPKLADFTAFREAPSVYFFPLPYAPEQMAAVRGTDRMTPMLLEMPLTSSVARNAELNS
ncbi:MAG: hypothetical protein K5981_04235 [Clostridia bacterium]|nr:hypothetical protein [Clostridia bacterium]